MGCFRNPTSKNAYVLSLVGIVVEFFAALVGCYFFSVSGSALCLVYGLENVVDFFSSAVVFWRFYTPGKLTPEREAMLEKREHRASMAISFVIGLLGLMIVAAATKDLIDQTTVGFDWTWVVIMAVFSFFILGSMLLLKFHYARVLNSSSLYYDGLCSLIGTVLALALAINTYVLGIHPNLWYLDPVVALICGVVAFFIGLHACIKARFIDGYPICSLKFWAISQGDSKTTSTTTKQGVANHTNPEETFTPIDEPNNKDVELSQKKKKTGLSEIV